MGRYLLGATVAFCTTVRDVCSVLIDLAVALACLLRRWQAPALRLENISAVCGGLYLATGKDDFGGFAVKMYALPLAEVSRVRDFSATRVAML